MKRRACLAAMVVSTATSWGCGAFRPDPSTLVRRMDLPLTVEASGSLRASRSAKIAPPDVPEVWNFKIAQMTPESREVRKGDPVLTLDTTILQQELEKKTAERDQASKEIEKKKLELGAQALDVDGQLAEAQAKMRRAKLKVDVPEDLRARVDLERDRLDLELAEAEVRSLGEQRRLRDLSGAAEMEILKGRRDRAAERVRTLQEGLHRMTLTAPQDGLIVYMPNWRGDKHKVGDPISKWERPVEVADLSAMEADATVGEADASRVKIGQAVKVRLEASPERDYSARIVELSPVVRRQSSDVPVKVISLRFTFDRSDTERMRPGMRFRAEIEVDRVTNALVIPLDAVFLRPGRPVAYRLSGTGLDEAPLKLGARNKMLVQVLAGLEAGDRISLSPPEEEEGGPREARR